MLPGPGPAGWCTFAKAAMGFRGAASGIPRLYEAAGSLKKLKVLDAPGAGPGAGSSASGLARSPARHDKSRF